MSFNEFNWITQLSSRPIKESVEEILDATLEEADYMKCRGIMGDLESLQWIEGGLEYLDGGYEEDAIIKEKFEKVYTKLNDMEKILWPEE